MTTQKRKIRGAAPTTRLARRIRKAGMTLAEFADKIGVSHYSVRAWTQQGIPASHRDRVAKALGAQRVPRQPVQQPVQPVQPAQQPDPYVPYNPYPVQPEQYTPKALDCMPPPSPFSSPWLALPLVRLYKQRDGVIGYPWVDILAVAPGSPDAFYQTTRYFCRLPGKKAPFVKWFTDRDLFGDGANLGEYATEW